MGDPLKNAVMKGDIQASYVDRAVGRILTQMERFHMLDGQMLPRAKMADVASEHSASALKATEKVRYYWRPEFDITFANG